MNERPPVGFVGLGLMGAPMVRRLLSEGWPVTVWNLEPERYAEVPGATVAKTPAAVRAAASTVMMCVLDATAVEAVCFAPGGIASAAVTGGLLIDSSTINPDATRALAARLGGATGMRWVDAPMSGGPPLAAEGRLTFMVGGADVDMVQAEPLLASLAANVTHVGALGAGQTVKILNQAIVGASYVLMAEALALAKAAGIDAGLLPQALAGGLADSQALQRVYVQMATRAWEPPRGYARQLDKDLKNVAGFTHLLGLELPLLQHVAAHYHSWAADYPMEDGTAIARLYD